MHWSWVAANLLVVVALGGGGALHRYHWVDSAEAGHVHSHGHWHDGDYHEHHHEHEDAITESLDDHSPRPHEHGWTDAPDDQSEPTPLIVAPARRNQWKQLPLVAPVMPMLVFAPSALNKPPSTPPPRSRAGPMLSQLIALRSIVLQV